MYHEIIIPSATKQTIQFPEEFVGRQIEIIAFPVEEKIREVINRNNALDFWKANSIDMSNFKFNRSEANER
ncbi:hypothetical protein ABIB40_001771 [Pedobacter sp. UYP30]|uniref:hypothetical protein n=1 Tax=Pedobacter sp. UYP30 TaxID=1756400 RepID=UPI003398630F